MIDFSTLPSSEAGLLNDAGTMIDGVHFTFIENMDERKLYRDLNKRLINLEISLEKDTDELTSIKEASIDFSVALDEKEEVLLRLDWLRRLYEVKEAVQLVDTKEYAERLRRMIASVQTCPMKGELMAKLDSLVMSLPSEQTEPLQVSDEDKLMEKAIEEAGDTFINLGKVGRDFVIANVLKQFGEKVTVEDIKEHTTALEQRVASLVDVKGQEELVSRLEILPLVLFTSLSSERKAVIAERLVETNKWNGLATLERMILQWDRFFTNEVLKQQEAENTIVTVDGKAALALDIKHVVDGRVHLA